MADDLVEQIQTLIIDSKSIENDVKENLLDLNSVVFVTKIDTETITRSTATCHSTPEIVLTQNGNKENVAMSCSGGRFAHKIASTQNNVQDYVLPSSNSIEAVNTILDEISVQNYELYPTPVKCEEKNEVSEEDSSEKEKYLSPLDYDDQSLKSISHENENKSSDISDNMKYDIICSRDTALVYDERMALYYCKEKHVEQPQRVVDIYKKLDSDGLVKRCKIIGGRFASTDELLTKHSAKYIDTIKSVKGKSDEELEILAMDYDSIYFHPAVTECAMLAVGCTLNVVEEVIAGKALNGVAVVRPPGHHALNHCAMGFCYFNNVAIAAMFAIEKYGFRRILIVDWDVHYGNGTHKMFESDPRVLFFSMHRYDHQTFWPCLSEGNFDAVGIERGEGFNIHVAWNRAKMGDAEYLLAFEKILIPVAKEFNPELIIVSSGFDSGDGDPLGNCKVSPAGYAHMTRKLMHLANGKVVIVLEGGYNLKTISNSMAACVSSLLNDPLPTLELKPLHPEGLKSIKNTLVTIQKYWNSLQNEQLAYLMETEQNMEPVEFSSEDESEDLINDKLLPMLDS